MISVHKQFSHRSSKYLQVKGIDECFPTPLKIYNDLVLLEVVLDKQ